MVHALSCLAILASAVLLPQEKKIPVPDAAVQKEKEKFIRDIYKEEYRSKASADRIAFSERLLKQGKETKNDTDAQYVMLRESMTIAGEEKAVATAFGAIDALAGIFEDIKDFDLKFSVLAKAKAGVKSSLEATQLAEHYISLAQQSWKINSYDSALRALTEASPTAKAGKDLPQILRVNDLIADTKEVRDAYERVKPAEAVLANNDQDPEANAEVGWFLCLCKGDSERGLRLLSKGPADKGPHAELTLLVQEETKAQASKEFFALGEKWSALAAKGGARLIKRNALSQARRLYERALDGAEGLNRAQIEKRLVETKGTPAAGGGMSAAGIDLLRPVDPKKDGFAGAWERDGSKIKVVKGSFARLELPYEPPDEFDLTAVIEQGPSTEAVLLVSRGGKGFAVALKPNSSTASIYSSAGHINKPGVSIPKNAPNTLSVLVRFASIKVLLNGKEVEDWKPDQSTLGHIQAWAPRNAKMLGIGANGEAVAFHSITVVEVTGRGKRHRP